MTANENQKERYVVQLRLDADLSESLAIAMKEDGDENKAGWIKWLLHSKLDLHDLARK